MEIKSFYAQDELGNILPGATCSLLLAGTSTLATGLENKDGNPLSNPFNADIDGLSQFSAPDGIYDLRVESGALDSRVRVEFGSVAQLKEDLASPDGAGLVGGAWQTVDTIAQARQLLKTVPSKYAEVSGYYAKGDGGGGLYYLDPTDTVSADNGGSILVANDGGRWKLNHRGIISVKQFGAKGDGVTNDTATIQAADDAAVLVKAVLDFRYGDTYMATELFIRSRVVKGNGATLKKSSTTAQGFFNWGTKPLTMVDGCVENLTIDANGQNNVVNFRIYGNHHRPKLRNLRLLDSDFYAISVGGLTSPGDKLDQVDGLDIDGLYIESTRGNVALSTEYSLGLELFPGVTCFDWRIRNVQTKGKIINKIHSVDRLDVDHLDFVTTAVFDPLASGYFEINNCNNVVMGENVRTVSGTSTYYSLNVAGYRVSGGLPVTNVLIRGSHERVQVSTVDSVTLGSGFKCSRLDPGGAINSLKLNGVDIFETITNSDAVIGRLDILASTCGILRLGIAGGSVADFNMIGGTLTCPSNNSRFKGTVGRINGTAITMRGTPQSFAIQSDGAGTDITLSGCMIDGNTDWNRPLYVSNGGAMRVVKNNFDRLVSSTLTASGSQALTQDVNNTINGV